MNSPTPLPAPALDLAVRVGCELVYETSAPTPALVTFKPRQDAYQSIRQESMRFEPELAATEFEDDHLNIVYRLVMKPGRNALRYDAIVMVPSLTEDFAWRDEPIPPHELPASILRYTLPTRYCDTDKLLNFAWKNFGHLPHGLARVRGICDWLNKNIDYRTLSGYFGLRCDRTALRRLPRSGPHGGRALPQFQSPCALCQRLCAGNRLP